MARRPKAVAGRRRRRRRQTEAEGFYTEGAAAAADGDAVAMLRERLLKAVRRRPDDVRLLSQVARALSRGSGSSRDPKVLAERMKAALEQIEGQILPEEEG